MLLSELTDLPIEGPDHKIKRLTQDSRQVEKYCLFAAAVGTRIDGSKFIQDALAHGATALLIHDDVDLPDHLELNDIAIVRTPNVRQELAHMAARYFKLQPEHIAAVTGTSGKTSTVYFTQQLWTALGYKAASFGTLGVRGPGMVRSGSMTTPDPIALQGEVADLASAGVSHLSIEASSHGLDQYRLDGLKIKTAAFTNLSHEHLDYHIEMEAYFSAKKRLFGDLLPEDGTAVLNADIPEYAGLMEICERRKLNKISFGRKGREIQIKDISPQPDGQALKIEVFGQSYDVLLPLVGEFQAYNALCALGIVAAGFRNDTDRIKTLIAHLEHLKGAPGRLQRIPGHPKGAVYVDYAHKPEALRSILTTLKPYARNRLICVFGCGGDRDRDKRFIMGKIADELADIVIVTDDNPRSEDPATIRAAILEATPNASEIGDRRDAIRHGINLMENGDVLVIAGKGHETGQTVKGQTHRFDDIEETQNAIKELQSGQ